MATVFQASYACVHRNMKFRAELVAVLYDADGHSFPWVCSDFDIEFCDYFTCCDHSFSDSVLETGTVDQWHEEGPLTPGSRFLPEKLTGLQLAKNSPHFMEPEGIWQHSERPRHIPSREPVQSSPCLPIPLLPYLLHGAESFLRS